MIPNQSTQVPGDREPTSTTHWASRWTSAVFSLHGGLTALLAFAVFRAARQSIADPDLWWHLKNAQYLFTTGRLPLTDTYSFTAAGSAWTPHAWIAEIPFYLGFRIAGLSGVFVVYLVLSEAIVLGTFYLAYRASKDIKNSFVVAVFAVALMTVSIGPRTLLFGWLYLILLLLFLKGISEGKNRYYFFLPPLFCLWINTHASWLTGLVVFGVFFASGLVEGSWGLIDAKKWSPEVRRNLFICGVLSVGALFINPTGYRAVAWPLGIFHPNPLSVGVGYITELRSIDFHSLLGKIMLGFLLVVVLTNLLSSRRWKLNDVGLLLLALYFSLTYTRLVFFAAIIITPLLAERIKILPHYQQHKEKAWLNAVILLVVIGGMFAGWPRPGELQDKVAAMFPVKASDYLKAHSVRGRVFNEYIWGGYLIWNNPDLPVFIDGRGDIFDAKGIFRDYVDANELRNTFAIFDKYGIDYILYPSNSPLSEMLKNTAGWKLEYSDEVSCLYHRSTAESKHATDIASGR
jgi:hypothetical protein